MAISRYANRFIFENNYSGYKKVFFRDRGVNKIYQYSTPVLGYPTAAQLEDVETISFVWAATDKLYNIANRVYGDPSYWWVIAWFNKKPTEAHFSVGDIVYVPTPIEEALRYF